MNSFVGFSTGKSFFARLIRLAQLGRYSHCFFAFEFNKKWYVVDSSRSGIKIRSLDIFMKHSKLVKRFSIESTNEQLKNILQMCTERSYDKYPFGEILGNAIQLIVKWSTFGLLKIDNPFSMGEKYPRCHEFVAIILRDFYGYKIDADLDDTDLLWLEDYLNKKLS